ncbi:hypothetical protein GCM10023210_19410 [Chryseobacterium ginsengisoli]|uniref:Transposase n=1 Tax=Chryseobacterium ginsengisoli TaxID=363853 RepID=A0ABP9MAY7_9FLAO
MKNLLVEYSFSPGLYDEIRRMELEVYDDFSYKLIFNWYKKYREGDIFDIEDAKTYRRENIFNDFIPEQIKYTLESLISFSNFELKTFYPELTESQKKEYTPLDVRHENYHFHRLGNRYWINVSPYIFKKEFLKTEQELLFGRFHEEITIWLDGVYDKLIQNDGAL